MFIHFPLLCLMTRGYWEMVGTDWRCHGRVSTSPLWIYSGWTSDSRFPNWVILIHWCLGCSPKKMMGLTLINQLIEISVLYCVQEDGDVVSIKHKKGSPVLVQTNNDMRKFIKNNENVWYSWLITMTSLFPLTGVMVRICWDLENYSNIPIAISGIQPFCWWYPSLVWHSAVSRKSWGTLWFS